MEQQLHSKALNELCWICGRYLQPAKKKRSIYFCADNATTLRDIFGVSVLADDALTHPKHFCQTCNTSIYNIRDAKSYYSGTFVGNHVHRTLKPANTTTLCESIVEVAQHHCPTMLHQSQEIARKFSNVFRLFRDCHAIYDGKTVTDDDIVELDHNIKAFMSYYRSTFPHATVLPKMHMLEEHVIPWMEKWHVGFGVMGEQGAESIHKHFNSLERTYHNIPDGVDRLRNIMKEHLRHTAPSMVALQPAPKKLRRELLLPIREE